MTTETARILAQALLLRDTATDKLKELLKDGAANTPEGAYAARVFVHEQRVINRIVDEDRDT